MYKFIIALLCFSFLSITSLSAANITSRDSSNIKVKGIAELFELIKQRNEVLTIHKIQIPLADGTTFEDGGPYGIRLVLQTQAMIKLGGRTFPRILPVEFDGGNGKRVFSALVKFQISRGFKEFEAFQPQPQKVKKNE